MQRVRIALKSFALEIIGTEEPTSRRCMETLLPLGARLRRQTLAPEGATRPGKRGLTAQRGQGCHECRHALA
jgi:hypothetical protein